MSKVKNIYTFGTSFTKGGGFEFWSFNEHKLKNTYANLNEEFTQHNFSWPGQLDKLITDDSINIINLAESGYGNERMYYETYKIINSDEFDSETDIFLFEFSYLGRTQLFSRIINKPIILNWSQIFDPNPNIIEPIRLEYNGMAYRYWEDERTENKILKELEPTSYEPFLQRYINNQFNTKNVTELMANNSLMFLSYLIQNNIKFWFTQPPLTIDVSYFKKLDWESRLIRFDKESRGFMLDFAVFSFNGTGTITAETHGYINDGHTGFVGNKMIATKVYNHLVDVGLLDEKKISLDVDSLTEIKNTITKNVFKHNKIF